MNDFKKLELMSESDGGVLRTALAKEAGVAVASLMKYVRSEGYERVQTGVYLAPDAERDEEYLLQLRCPKTIFSHDSALYLHGLVNRETLPSAPLRATVTAPTGYNPEHLTKDGVKVYTIKAELFDVGASTVQTALGHEVRVYDRERTICDIVRSRNSMEKQLFYDALRAYARSREKNLQTLMDYAKLFHVDKLVQDYMALLIG